MKIVEIKEPREGFVYESEDETMVYMGLGQSSSDAPTQHELWMNGGTIFSDDFVYSNCKLIGALNITHRIEDAKLVEIPRREVEVGDVFRSPDGMVHIFIVQIYDDESYDAIGSFCDKCVSISQHKELLIEDGGRKIGIMGVTHEIDWSMK